MLALRNPDTYDAFYSLLDHACTIGRPISVVGHRGSGKTVLLGALQSEWRTKTTFTESEVLFFSPSPGESDVGNLSYLHRRVSEKSADTKSPNELCDKIEAAILKSEIKLLRVDNAHEIGEQFFGMVWKCIESLRHRGRIVGSVFAFRENAKSKSGAENAMPILGTYKMSRMSLNEVLDTLEFWLPTAGRELSDRLTSGTAEAEELRHLLMYETRGSFRAVGDLAYIWKNQFEERPLTPALLVSILQFTGGNTATGQMELFPR